MSDPPRVCVGTAGTITEAKKKARIDAKKNGRILHNYYVIKKVELFPCQKPSKK